jgi:hypothetical protein
MLNLPVVHEVRYTLIRNRRLISADGNYSNLKA